MMPELKALQRQEPPEGQKSSGRWIPGTNIVRPSISYRENCRSFTYGLSELVFGSLLASYILGFFAFGMNLSAGLAVWKPYSELFGSIKLFQLGQYLFISATFAYLTAAYYVTYHNSILTMPHFATHKLRADFGIALLQAVLFGVSMIRPEAFLLCVGISLVRVFWRQSEVFKELSELFYRHQKKKGDEEIDHKKERMEFKTRVELLNRDKKYGRCLEGWMPITLRMWAFAVLLIVLGSVSELRHYCEWGKHLLPQANVLMARIQFVVYSGVFGLTWYLTTGVFKKGAEHPLDEHNPEVLAIDVAAEEIVNSLGNGSAKAPSS